MEVGGFGVIMTSSVKNGLTLGKKHIFEFHLNVKSVLKKQGGSKDFTLAV